jgi:hypothetical protein
MPGGASAGDIEADERCEPTDTSALPDRTIFAEGLWGYEGFVALSHH